MKISLKYICHSLFIFLLFTSIATAQQAKDTTMIVNGVCGMCEYTIESAAQLKGVELAEWDVKTKVLTLRYDTTVVDLVDINTAINDSGYDTEYNTAPDEAYNSLHKCCRYRDPEVVKDHQND